jgi:LacI family transcriptional regulator
MTIKNPNNTTLKDVAAYTGVSITAVSHVLNNRLGRVRVSDETQKRIRLAANKLNYVPQLKARSMATNKSYAVAALYSTTPSVGDLSNAAYFIHALCGVEEICRLVHYHCMFATCDLQSPEKFVQPRLMQDGSVDGVILVGYTSDEIARKLTSLGLPCVHMGSNLDPSIDMQHIDPDMDTAFEQAVEQLYALGHRRIELYFPKGPGPEAIGRRFSELGSRYADLQTITVHSPNRANLTQDVFEHARQYVADPNRPTAYICHYAHATGFSQVFTEAGLNSPRDYSLIACSTSGLAESMTTPNGQQIALIDIPARLTARYATACLLEKLDVISDALPQWQQKMPCQFTLGQTVGPAPRL